MVALRGLLFAVFVLALTIVISLFVVGVITVVYKVLHRQSPQKTAAK